jgi:hypothetical protein
VRSDQYTDDRKKWDWQSKYPSDARQAIKFEAVFLISSFVLLLILTGLFLSLANHSFQIPLESLIFLHTSDVDGSPRTLGPPILKVEFRLLSIYFAGSVGGLTFSIKWLVHATAKGSWHLDRRYWRLLIPFLGGVYACVVLTLFDAGFLGGAQPSDVSRPVPIAAALAFLVGYFSDGVSGLLSNVANAVFGTLDKK